MNKNKTQIKSESSLVLSSDSIENEHINVLKYLGLKEYYFSYIRVGQQSCDLKIYPTLQEAEEASISQCKVLMAQANHDSWFEITDQNKKLVLSAKLTKTGRITYNEIPQTELSNQLINNEDMATPIEQNVLPVSYNETQTITNMTLRNNLKAYIDAGIFLAEDIEFLSMSHSDVEILSQQIQTCVSACYKQDANTFAKSFSEASKSLIPGTLLKATGEPVKEGKMSLHDWNLYRVVHGNVPLTEILGGNRSYAKVNGIIFAKSVGEKILDAYDKGHRLIAEACSSMDASAEKDHSYVTSDDAGTPSSDMCNNHTTTTSCHLSDLVDGICATIMVHQNADNDLRVYLSLKGSTLSSDIKGQTNGVLSAELSGRQMTLHCISGTSVSIGTQVGSEDARRREVKSAIMRMLVGAAISSKSRDLLAKVVDLEEIERLYLDMSTQKAA